MRVSIYILTSMEDDPQVPKGQIDLLRAMVVRDGWELVHVYHDIVSALKSDRPAYQQMLDDARNHRFDVLMFWALEQLSQYGAGSTALLLNKLSTWGIGFCSYTEQHLDSCHTLKDAVSSIISSIAQQENIHISTRTRVGLAQQKRTGKRGPKGRLGPGRPPIKFDQKRAQALRAAKTSYADIAAACGVSAATIRRFFESNNYSC